MYDRVRVCALCRKMMFLSYSHLPVKHSGVEVFICTVPLDTYNIENLYVCCSCACIWLALSPHSVPMQQTWCEVLRVQVKQRKHQLRMCTTPVSTYDVRCSLLLGHKHMLWAFINIASAVISDVNVCSSASRTRINCHVFVCLVVPVPVHISEVTCLLVLRKRRHLLPPGTC